MIYLKNVAASIKKNLCYRLIGPLSMIGLVFSCSFSYAQQSAHYGEVFTPKGDLRVLIICVGFKDFDNAQKFPNWKPNGALPDFVQNNAIPESFYNNYEDFDKYKNIDSVKNLSKLYQEMSFPNGNFRIVADVYPKCINIDPGGVSGRNCWATFNKRVFKEMYKQDPDFDWSKYDRRVNNPNFRVDASSYQPDGKPDYVVLMYRADGRWQKQLFPYAKAALGNFGGGASVLAGVNDMPYGDYTITRSGFYACGNACYNPEAFNQLFKHELAHELFASPHYMAANGAVGKHFYVPSGGWGCTVSNQLFFQTFNAWERYILGWIPLDKDLRDATDNGVYKLEDFATTGDAIRIKVPHTKNEYIWLENHQKLNVFDESIMAGQLQNFPKGTSGIPYMEKGLYMYNECILDDPKHISPSMVSNINNVNTVSIYNAIGNYDFDCSGYYKQHKHWYWNNKLYAFERQDANPYAGMNYFTQYRADFDSNQVITNSGNFNGARTESYAINYEIVEGDTLLTYASHGGIIDELKGRRRSDAFQVGDVLSMCSNPPLTNNPPYKKKEGYIDYKYLNGLKVEILEQDSLGTLTISVVFNNHSFDQNARLCGRLKLANIPNAADDIDLIVQKGIHISIDQSKTPNTLRKEFANFVTPTVLKVEKNVKMRLETKAKLSISATSTMELGEKSELTLQKKAKIHLKNEARLIVNKGAALNYSSKNQLRIVDNAEVLFKKGAIFRGKPVKKAFVLNADNQRRPFAF